MKAKIVYIVFLLWLMLPLQAQVIERHGEYYTMNGEVFISSTAFCGYLRNSNPKLFAEYNRGYRIAMSEWPFSFTKIFHDGQILILRGDKTYTLQGQEVNTEGGALVGQFVVQ